MQQHLHDRSQTTLALQERLVSNQQGNFNLSTWLCDQLRDIGPESRVLTLGAGTGAHFLRYTAAVGPRGLCAALDISQTSLAQLQRQARLQNRSVLTIRGDMDDLCSPNHWPALQGLTHVVVSYALYYSQNASTLIRALIPRLAPGGCILVVGPAPGNNTAWYQLLQSGGFTPPPWLLSISETFWKNHIHPQRPHFARWIHHKTSNRVPFFTPEALLRYWRSNIYCQHTLDKPIEQAIFNHFAKHKIFWNTKNINMIRMEVTHGPT